MDRQIPGLAVDIKTLYVPGSLGPRLVEHEPSRIANRTRECWRNLSGYRTIDSESGVTPEAYAEQRGDRGATGMTDPPGAGGDREALRNLDCRGENRARLLVEEASGCVLRDGAAR